MKRFAFSLLAAIALLVTGCKGDDPTSPAPEDADDNFITSVVLSVDGASYAAVIEGNDITVTVPYTTSLDGAEAGFEYTTSATILPDPAAISDWDTERQFRVTSYSGKTNDYTYLVVKDDIHEEGDVVLKTDAEVQAFGDRGVSVLKGSLTIGDPDGTNTVSDIRALTALREIGGDLIINNTYTGIALEGLDNLIRLGGLHIGAPDAVSSAPELYFASLESLEEVAGDIVICNDKVEWFEAGKLARIGGSFVMRSAKLTSIKLPALTQVGVNFELSGSNDDKAGGSMTTVELNELTTVGGEVLLRNLAVLDAVKFEKLSKAGAFLLPTIPYEMTTISLPALTQIDGDLDFTSKASTVIGGMAMNTGIRSIDMGKLTHVGGTYTIAALAELQSLPSFTNPLTLKGIYFYSLKKVQGTELDLSAFTFTGGGEIYISYMEPVTTIVCPAALDAKLNLYFNKALTSVEGLDEVSELELSLSNPELTLPSLKTVTGDARFNSYGKSMSAPALETIAGNFLCALPTVRMTALKEVGGYLQIDLSTEHYDFSNLQKVGGQLLCMPSAYGSPIVFPSLIEVGTAANPAYAKQGRNENYDSVVYGSCEISTDGVTEVQLPSLRKVGGAGFSLDLGWGGAAFEELNLPALEQVEGVFQIHQNGLVDVPGGYTSPLRKLTFGKLNNVGSVFIQGCVCLHDYSAFKPVISLLSAEKWYVAPDCGYSPSYEDMVNGDYAK